MPDDVIRLAYILSRLWVILSVICSFYVSFLVPTPRVLSRTGAR